MLHVSDWTAGVEIALVDQPNSKRVVARIHEGEKAQAVTGEGHSIPLRVLAKHDHPDAGVKAATSFIACTTPARGAWTVWHSDQIVEIENFLRQRTVPSLHLVGETQDHIGHRRVDDLPPETFPTRTHVVNGQQRLRPAAW